MKECELEYDLGTMSLTFGRKHGRHDREGPMIEFQRSSHGKLRTEEPGDWDVFIEVLVDPELCINRRNHPVEPDS